MKSAPITFISERIILTLALMVVIALSYWLMRRGWKRQGMAQQEIVAPCALGSSELRYEGIYASTTYANQPLRRIVVHGLGARTSVHVGFDAEQIDIYRPGSTSFSIPRSDLIGISRASGIAGKFVGDRSLTVLTWRLGGIEVDTGLLVGDALAKDLVA